MKILVSWSSGKDSAWMLHIIRAEQLGTPGALLTTVNESADRVAMHAVRTEVLRAQADAAGLPLITVPIPSPCSNEIYEERMAAACRAAVADGFTHVAFGDLFLEDVRRYREERLAGSGLTPMFPLWLRPTPALAREMIASGLEARLTCVDPRVLPASLAGRHRSLRRTRRVSHVRRGRAYVFETRSRRARRHCRTGRIRLHRPLSRGRPAARNLASAPKG